MYTRKRCKPLTSTCPTSPALITRMKKSSSLVLAHLLTLCLVAGCAETRYRASHIHPSCQYEYEECLVDMTKYKSVQERSSGQDPTLALAVAISGGGYRAANFAAGVLLQLEETKSHDFTGNNILSEIDYFSTVSGGGFAAAAYISSLYDHTRLKKTGDGYSFAQVLRDPPAHYQPVNCPYNQSPDPNQITDPCIRKHLQGFYRDFLKDFSKDFLSWLTLGIFNEGGHFEKTVDDHILGRRYRASKLESSPNSLTPNPSLTLGNLFVRHDDPNTQVTLPFWVVNATAYANGAIFPFTPEHLKLYRIRAYYHRCKKHKHQNRRQTYDHFIANLPLSVAATASASFPGATPAVKFKSKMDPKNPYLYLFDGGLADNLGVITALRLLDDEADPRVTAKVLIVIDAYIGTFAPFSSTPRPPSIGNVAKRSLNISLDSWRGRYREIIRKLCDEKDIKPVFLSFDDLADMTNMEPLLECGLDPNDVMALLPKPAPTPTPFELLRSISTLKIENKGRLSTPEQNLLLAAGRYVVWQKTDEILTKLSW